MRNKVLTQSAQRLFGPRILTPSTVIFMTLLLVSYCCPTVFLLFSYCFPTVVLLLSYCCPTVVLLFSYCFPTNFLLFSCCFPTVFLLFSSLHLTGPNCNQNHSSKRNWTARGRRAFPHLPGGLISTGGYRTAEPWVFSSDSFGNRGTAGA